MKRSNFLRKALVFCCLVLIPVTIIESCSKQTTTNPANVNFTLDLTSSANASLKTIGGYLVTKGVIVIRSSSTVYNAFSATCTYAPCTLEYVIATDLIYCPCHSCTYDPTTGSVLSGPPPAALAKYTVTQAGNILTVKS